MLIRLIKKAFTVFDWPLLLILCTLAGIGLLSMYSAVGVGTEWRFEGQIRNFILAFLVMWAVAMIPPKWLMQVSVPFYILGVVLLIAVLLFGITSKGATRWLNVGVVIQPSEMLKLSVPMMLAWYFDRYAKQNLIRHYIATGFLLLLPFFLILKQPDLGTALLVFATGFFVMYFAGMSFKVLLPAFLLGVLGLALILHFEDVLCSPQFDWVILHDYQKHRVCTLLDPTSDPLGKGFHTIQGMIAIGSGGIFGKGYMQGTQSHLDFVPESTTDFIFSVFAEEFGLYGCIILLLAYVALIFRGMMIAVKSSSVFGCLLAGAISLMFFVYVFVNIGMVSGILPIVGVPLPFMSYGGTALVTLGLACGILMSVSYHIPKKKKDKEV
ncbi:rod shape-determining protein RodA [Basilea psittacipulmonis]|uniref:Peptidoglycan glycosyltransferase MrdB n=1 Tax=Basilea psittacipulmonis DSM 24701 TaxID=1072685 RepID=A0A077DB62_9BURK|nr:rod shape-determining protein RodA [Basilea psittacipulmonis]AIL32115.1 ADP-ribosylglycohydrolase [Basilea psittacipulmonis DSM 24701]